MWPLKSNEEFKVSDVRIHRGKTRIQDLPSSTICQMKGGTGGIWGGGGAACLAKHIKRPLAHNIHSIYTTLLTREDLSQAAHRDFTQGITMFTRSWKYKHTVQTKIFSQIIRCLHVIPVVIPCSSFSYWGAWPFPQSSKTKGFNFQHSQTIFLVDPYIS